MKRMFILILIILAVISQPHLTAQNGCRIELRITGDFPANEPIDPEVVALDGVDVRNRSFQPGRHQLTIDQTGYFSLKEELVIPAEAKIFKLERVLVTRPRIFSSQMRFDVTPSKLPWPVQVTIAPISEPDNAHKLVNGDSIKPGAYKIRIMSEGYHPIVKKVYVWPHNVPYIAKDQLIAAGVELRIVGKDCRFFLIDLNTSVPHLLLDGLKVKPGTYDLKYENFKEHSVIRRRINIFPSSQPYVLGKPIALPPSDSHQKRKLAFQFLADDKELVLASSITINGRDFSFADSLFAPGSDIKIVARFAGHKTLKAAFQMPEGHGVFIYKQRLTPLVPYEFSLRYKTIALDDITYKYQFYLDGHPIEEHLLRMEIGVNRFYYTLMHEKQPQRLCIYGGYRFMERSTEERRFAREKFTEIDIDRLLQHLAVKNKLGGQPQVIEVLAKLIDDRQDYARLQRQGTKALAGLADYLRNLPDSDSQVQKRKQQLIDLLTSPVEKSNLVTKPTDKSKLVLVKLNFIIDYDFAPPVKYPQWKAIFISEKDQIVRIMTGQGRRMAAGTYQLTLKQPGYIDMSRKVIIPEAKNYTLRFSMSTRARRLSFDIFDKQIGKMVQAHRILVNGDPASFQHEFRPGTTLDVVIDFNDYRTYHGKVTVTPGEGPFIIKVPLQKK